jgi:hypothetical protein
MKKEFEVTRTKEDGSTETVKCYVATPKNNSLSAADRYRAKVFNQCLMDGIFTKTQLSKVLIERGVWNEQKAKEETKIGEELTAIEKELFLGNGNKKAKLSEGKKLALKMKDLRNQLRQHIAEKIAMEENTAESLADNARFDFLVSECTFYENHERVYKNIEDYNENSGDTLAYTAAANLARLIYQYDLSLEESLPENVWLKTFGLINKDLELVNEDGITVDEDGRKINKFGHYLDEDNRRVDKGGNLLNEDGSYVLQVEYEKDIKKRVK